MTTVPFGSGYAGAYDLLYRDKDYAGECDMLERIFSKFEGSAVETILDLGCGTGSHAIPLAQRGYRVVGVDRSEHMLAQARAKTNDLPGEVTAPVFVEGDLGTFVIDETFDVAVLMFNVLGYQVEASDVRSALGNAARHLNREGLLVCDIWHAPAVISSPPEPGCKTFENGSEFITRIADVVFDAPRQRCEITFRFENEKGDRFTDDSPERHIVHFFFPQELASLFEDSGLELILTGAFPDFETPPADDGCYSVVAIGRLANPSMALS